MAGSRNATAPSLYGGRELLASSHCNSLGNDFILLIVEAPPTSPGPEDGLRPEYDDPYGADFLRSYDVQPLTPDPVNKIIAPWYSEIALRHPLSTLFSSIAHCPQSGHPLSCQTLTS
ncbi:MAG: hypothetical protein ABW185_11300 [Sedimenticola sp.]